MVALPQCSTTYCKCRLAIDPREVPVTPALMRQKKESLRGHHQWFEPLLQSGTLPTYCGRPDRILTEDLLAYVKATEGSNKEKVRG
jgi:hypothetical protein